MTGVIPLVQNATLDRIRRDIKDSHIKQMVLLPIQGIEGTETEELIEKTKNHKEFIIFGSINPNDGHIQEKIDKYLKMDIKGFKINPHVWNIDFNDKRVVNLLGYLSETKKPILSCSGIAILDTFRGLPKSIRKSMNTQTISKFVEVLKKIPNLKLIFGHSGVEQVNEVIEVMKQYPQTLAEISTQPAQNIRKMINILGDSRLLFGSDYPFFNQAFPLLSVLRATEDETERKNIFSANAKRLLGQEDTKESFTQCSQ